MAAVPDIRADLLVRLDLHVPDPAAREGRGRSNDFRTLLQGPCTGDSCSSCDGRRCALQFVMIGPHTYGDWRCRGDYAWRGGAECRIHTRGGCPSVWHT